jgi:hypothetical protein
LMVLIGGVEECCTSQHKRQLEKIEIFNFEHCFCIYTSVYEVYCKSKFCFTVKECVTENRVHIVCSLLKIVSLLCLWLPHVYLTLETL